MHECRSFSLPALLLTLIAGGLPCIAAAQNTPLQQTFNLALEHTPDIELARHQLSYDRQQLAAARADLLPSVSATARIDLLSDSTSTGSQSGLQLEQTVFDLPRLIHTHEQSLLHRQSSLALDYARRELMLRSAAAVYNVLKAVQSVRVAAKQVESLENNFQRAELAFTLGASKVTDKLDAQARLDLARAELVQQRSALQQYEFEYFLLTGQKQIPFRHLVLSADATERNDLLNQTDLSEPSLEELRQMHPLLHQAELNVEQQNARLRQALGKRLPVVSARAGGTWYAEQSELDSHLSLNASWALFNSHGRASSISQARIQRQMARTHARQREQAIQLDINRNRIAILAGKERLNALQQAVTSSHSALEATREGLRLGLRSAPDLLDAEQQYFDTLRQLIQARYDFLYAVLKNRLDLGQLVLEDLAQLDTLFTKPDPTSLP